jgi:hypothetical protein
VKFHLTHIYKKLGVSSRTEAVAKAFQDGLMDDLMGQAMQAKPEPEPARS